MRSRAALAVVTLALSAVPAGAQTWTPGRTPWGDPDLQGNYSNKYEQGTPFERPPEFAGRRIEDITGAELTQVVRERAVEVLLNAPFTGGDPVAGNFGGAPAFYDRFEASRGGRPWLVVDPPDGQVPALTPDGQRAAAARAAAARQDAGRERADTYTDRSLYDRCITRGLPGSMMPANYGNSYRIVQGPGFVAITYEMVHETRVIPVDEAAPLADTMRQYMGVARGRWDGTTLVVETTHFRGDQGYRGANAATLRLVERFTPVSAEKIDWSVTVDDPSTWQRPWTFAMPLTRSDSEAVFEYACHEGNRAMPNLLSAARTLEREPAPARAATASERGSPAAAPAAPPAIGPEVTSPLSGTWVLSDAGGRGNFAGFATARRLVIRESASAVVVETDTGTEGQTQYTTFRLDGSATEVPGPIGWETKATAARQADQLDVAMLRTIEGPDGPLRFEIRDVYRAGAGGTLTLERRQGSQTRRMVYTRAPR